MVVATSPRSASALAQLCRDASAKASVTHIYNGFDPDDFRHPAPQEQTNHSDSWRLVYTGTLYNLMSPEPLVQAIDMLAASDPDVAARIEVVVAGRRTTEQDRTLRRLTGKCRLNLWDYVSHADAIALMRSADALCVLVSDLPGADRVVPAKVFEYMASQKPIVAIAPEGEVWDLLRAHPAAFTCQPADVSRLREWLSKSVATGAAWPDGSHFDTGLYDRQRQAGHLAELLASCSN